LKTIRIALLSRERAELATQDAVVGIIDVAINDIAGPIADHSLARQVSDRSHGVQILALEEPQRIGLGNSLACGNLVIKVPQFAPQKKKRPPICFQYQPVLDNFQIPLFTQKTAPKNYFRNRHEQKNGADYRVQPKKSHINPVQAASPGNPVLQRQAANNYEPA